MDAFVWVERLVAGDAVAAVAAQTVRCFDPRVHVAVGWKQVAAVAAGPPENRSAAVVRALAGSHPAAEGLRRLLGERAAGRPWLGAAGGKLVFVGGKLVVVGGKLVEEAVGKLVEEAVEKLVVVVGGQLVVVAGGKLVVAAGGQLVEEAGGKLVEAVGQLVEEAGNLA